MSRKIRVLIFSPALTAVSGVSTHVKMILDSNLAHRFELRHFQVGSEGRKENSAQRILRFVFSPFLLLVYLIKFRPDIVHLNTSMDHKAFWRDFSYLIIARLLGCKVVNQFHSGTSPTSLFSNPVLAFLLKRFLLASNIVTVLSSGAQSSHKAFEERIKVALVPNAIDTSGLLDVERNEASDHGPLKLVYVGRLVRSKGLLDALAALKILKDGGLNFSFRIAGSGPDEAVVRALISSLNLNADVSLLGPVFGSAKNELWRDSNVLVFPTYNEGLPYSLLEAMAAGCVPVICPVGGIPDVLRQGVHGMLVPAGNPSAVADAIKSLSLDRVALQRMSVACRQRIREHYTMDRMADNFAKIYTQLNS